MSTDTLADLATSTLADILRDPDAPLAARQRAAADALRHVAAERNRDLARERLAARRTKSSEAPQPSQTPADIIDLAPFPPEQREILVECARQLRDHGGPDPAALEELEDPDIELERDDDFQHIELCEASTRAQANAPASTRPAHPSG